MHQAPPVQPIPRTSESPLNEIGRRAADIAPVWPVAHAAGLQNQREIWADAQIKRKMDRLVAARALGVEEALVNGNDEVPGDINIKGDETHNHQHFYPAPAAATAPVATVANPVQSPLAAAAQPVGTTTESTTVRQRVVRGVGGFVVPALIGAGSLGIGAAGMALYHYATDRPDSVTTITQPGGKFEYRYGIEQRPTPTP